jgi:hypothetical protein
VGVMQIFCRMSYILRRPYLKRRAREQIYRLVITHHSGYYLALTFNYFPFLQTDVRSSHYSSASRTQSKKREMLEVMTAVSGTRCACQAERCDARRRLLDHANQCILAVVDGHVPIYYAAMEVEPDTHRPKRWPLTDVMDDGPSKSQVENLG